MVKFGINGFGRIGRLIIRATSKKCKEANFCSGLPQCVAINNPGMSADHMAYLLRHDSTHGPFNGNIMAIGSSIKVDGQIMEVLNEMNPEKIPWNKYCADYVVDATGLFTTMKSATAHMVTGVKRVIVTSPSKDIPTFIVGVNHECFTLNMTAISLASAASMATLPLLKIINDRFQIETALINAMSAITPTLQNVVDGGRRENWRNGRGALQNLIPTTNDICKTTNEIIPDLNGKIQALSVLVPLTDVSLVDITVKLCKPTTYQIFKCEIREAADTYMKGIVGFTEEPLVSSDIINDGRSCVFDGASGLIVDKLFVKGLAWYDNEWAYACRVVEMLNYMASRENCPKK